MIKGSILVVVHFVLIFIVLFLLQLSQGCRKNHPLEPDVPPDTVVVVDTVVVTDTTFRICDTVDLTIEFIVIGDQSKPNVYVVSLNEIFVYMFIVDETFSEPTEIKFEVDFPGVKFGDVITIKVVEGSRAAVVGSSIVDIKCSGG